MEIYLASPRGFCAGVVLAIDLVEIALEKYGAPVYVKHQICLLYTSDAADE